VLLLALVLLLHVLFLAVLLLAHEVETRWRMLEEGDIDVLLIDCLVAAQFDLLRGLEVT